MSSKEQYRAYLAEIYPNLEPIEILDENDELYMKLIRASWEMEGEIYPFSFAVGRGIIVPYLYKSQKRKALAFLKEKILEIKSEFIYIDFRVKDKYLLVNVPVKNLKDNVKELLAPCGKNEDDEIKVFNDKELVMIQRGEYEWEVLVS